MKKLFLIQLMFLIITGHNAQITVEDIDGNKYKAVTINGKIWMEENLKTTRLNDGTPILLESDNTGKGDYFLSH